MERGGVEDVQDADGGAAQPVLGQGARDDVDGPGPGAVGRRDLHRDGRQAPPAALLDRAAPRPARAGQGSALAAAVAPAGEEEMAVPVDRQPGPSLTVIETTAKQPANRRPAHDP